MLQVCWTEHEVISVERKLGIKDEIGNRDSLYVYRIFWHKHAKRFFHSIHTQSFINYKYADQASIFLKTLYVLCLIYFFLQWTILRTDHCFSTLNKEIIFLGKHFFFYHNNNIICINMFDPKSIQTKNFFFLIIAKVICKRYDLCQRGFLEMIEYRILHVLYLIR